MYTNYFAAKLMKYMKKVYHIERGINKLSDGRKNPKYKTAQVITPLLISFMLRIKSMNELKLMLCENEFRNVFPVGTELPKIDTFRDTVKVIEVDGLNYILVHTVKKSIINKVFDNGTIDAILYLMFIANNLMQLFLIRRLKRNAVNALDKLYSDPDLNHLNHLNQLVNQPV